MATQGAARWWAKNVVLPLIGTGGIVALATSFLAKKGEHEKIQPPQPPQIVVTVNLSDQLRANLAAASTSASVAVNSSLDPDADAKALALVEARKTGANFRLPHNAPQWLTIALHEVGERRNPDKTNSPRIIEYLRAAGLNEEANEITRAPWSGAFVSWALQHAGVDAPKTPSVRFWGSWGDQLQEPELGCLVLICWSYGEPSHVGFFLMDVGDTVLIVAGNTQDAVRVQAVAKKHVLQYRNPPKKAGQKESRSPQL